jgi:predicted extracellular nuclease/2',3'-cyclic-nucleotide 2'-phosphodiesterase (5'-nucleotidase family)
MHALPVRRLARGAAVGLGAAALALSSAVVPLGAAAAEPGDEVTLLGFNDFHGALDGGDAFACTVTNARAAAANSALISSGDNVGGSAFVSAVANDEPTIDFLNALGVDVTAIGNHEYDQGQDDLTGRIEPRTDFPDLAANVYTADGERLHEAYTVVDAGDVRVAVVGAVTTKTTAKVSPAAIEGLEFRDPVDSVNEAIGELDASGEEYDVLVVSYHEGASGSGEVGSAPENSDPIFEKIVNETSAEADAIFNGDSHRTYAYDAPVPGQDGEVRPIVQTGASAANLGSVTLALGEDGDWDAVPGATTLLPTAEADLAACAGDATYEGAKQVAADAIADAAVQGAVPVGSISGDITTAWNDSKAGYADGVRTSLTPVGDQATTKGDDRTRHSAAGNMLADSMKWYLEDSGKAGEHQVIGWMNPGGIRAELWNAESPTGEGEGVITYAEANNMVPFGNTLNSGEVTGAQFLQMLEEQWNRDDSGAFLAFSVSENVEYVIDGSAPLDERVREVRIDGEPIDPEATYTIVAASFLFEGGDGMATLAQAQDVRDSGVLDRDAFTEYLGAHPDLAPDHSQRQIEAQLLDGEDGAEGEDPVLRLTRLESLSLGAPEITSVAVDAGEYGSFEAPYGALEDAGRLGADVTLTGGLCDPAENPEAETVPLTITAVPDTGTEIVVGTLAAADCGEDGPPVVTPGDLQLNEVYGGGGNSGATFTHDFVELVNTSDEDIDLAGWSLQYASATGTFNAGNVLALEGVVPADGTFLIQLAKGSGGTEALPEPDLTGGINVSGTQGVLALSDAAGRLVCTGPTCVEDPAVVDLVGWGGATTFSGAAPAPRTTNATSIARVAATGENSTDFVAGAPPPPPTGGTDPGEPGEPGDAVEATIAEIQGTGAASPLVGKDVITEGVVTAVYATGGLNGYVIQTGGTGGALDFSTHEGSTAVFVHSPATASQVAIGDSVRVTGGVSEYYGSTQISVGAEGLEALEQELEPVEPATLAGGFPTEEAQREAIEHMLYLPGEKEFTVTDVYPTNRFGEVTLAIGEEPLKQAGDIMRPGEEATAYYESRAELAVLLDDGRTTNFQNDPAQPMSWLTVEEPVRVGATPTFTEPVVVAYSFDQWRLNTTTPWTSADTDGVDFENTRQDAPDEVGGDLQVSTFNVLNYFTTLGEDTPGCEPYTDMDGEGTTVRGGCDLRGAWGADDLERQESKIVEAISGTGADVVGLTEIENSARLGEEADEATATLVAALNEKDGEGTWAYVPSGEAYAELGLDGGQDVITNAIIYKPAEVTPRGGMQILADDPAFDNAREPLGQVFVPVRSGDGAGSGGAQVEGEPFLFTINHFKSKGSADAEDADLPADPVQGNSRTSRLQQAEALLAWGEETAAELGVEDVLHGGDFNSYTQEEPLQLFYEQGFVNLGEEHDPEGWSYSFGGMIGSLDHVLASPSAAERVTGVTDWQINGPESVMAQYGRFNSNAVDLYESGPFASSDHDPLIVGLDAGFEEAPTIPDFRDVRSTHPHYTAIMWAAQNGVVPGSEDGTFRPTRAADRATLAAGLYVMAGSPEVELPEASPFTDVRADHPHYAALLWAADEGILAADAKGALRPSAAVDRGTLALALHVAAGSPEVESPSGDAQADAIAWVRAEGLDEGIVDGEDFRPTARVDRAELAAFLHHLDRL